MEILKNPSPHRPLVSINFCRSTFRDKARTDPNQHWLLQNFLTHYFEFRFDDRPDFIFYADLNSAQVLKYSSNAIRIFYTGENILPNWNIADYALTHEPIYNERHWRLPLHRTWFDTRCSKAERDFDVISKRVNRFCNFIYTNESAKERIDFFNLLGHYKRIDSGGRVANNMKDPLGDTIEAKLDLVQQCKFTIAFENSSRSGYSTEKIVQPLLHGSIPIYWGDPDIELDFNPDCFINVHKYDSLEAVVKEIQRIDQDDNLWKKYVTAPIFKEGKLPEKLSDKALLDFFSQIFSKKRHQIPRFKKFFQCANG